MIVIINGAPRSGKDTFCDLCKEINPAYTFSISTVDNIKAIAQSIGWNGEKTNKARKFLSDLKDLTTEFNDYPFQDTLRRIKIIYREVEIFDGDLDKVVIFIHSREPEEIARFKEELGAYTLLIRRPEVENQETSNHADSNYLDYDYDFEIWNTGTLDDLKQKAREFLQGF